MMEGVDHFIAQQQTQEKCLSRIFKSSGRGTTVTGEDLRESVDTNIVDWAPVAEALIGFYKRRNKKRKRSNEVVPLWQAYTQEHVEKQRTGGDQRLLDLRNALSHLDTKYCRSTHQRQFHDAFIASCIRNIYRDEYSANYLRILEENKWMECRQEVFICCPRRFGKTFAVAMYVAAYAMTQPEQRICIFSPSRRQSKMLLDQVKKFICEYENGNQLIVKFNQEECWVQGSEGPNDVRVICSYPSKVRALLCSTSHTERLGKTSTPARAASLRTSASVPSSARIPQPLPCPLLSVCSSLRCT